MLNVTSITDEVARRRARELWKYFRPADPELLSSINALSQATREVSRPWNPNAILTGLAQLAAIHLHAPRAFITVAGDDEFYDIADATPDLDISKATVFTTTHDDQWVGCQSASETDGLCKFTVELAPGPPEERFFIVNDLTADSRTATLSCVCNEPGYRFYAGAPISTDEGIIIGSISVVDGKPRDGLTANEKSRLASFAAMAMDYLYLIRHAADGRKTMRMANGFHSFVEGRLTTLSPTEHSHNGVDGEEELDEYQLSPSQEARSVKARNSTKTEPSYFPSSIPLWPGSSRHGLTDESKDEVELLLKEATSSNKTQAKLKGMMNSDSLEREWTYARGANLLRESLDLDDEGGVLMYDTSHLALKSHDSVLSPYTATDLDGIPQTPGDFKDILSVGPEPSTYLTAKSRLSTSQPDAIAIASSCSTDPIGVGLANESDRFPPLSFAVVSELLKRYPRGKCWQMSEKLQSPIGESGQEVTWWSINEHSILRQLFPKAANLIFMPVWDAVLSQWCFVSFAYSTSELRSFSVENELSLSMAFGKTILSEIKRIETLRADRLKSDFIGSISHELRSPLHGILASLDLLIETHVDPLQASLINTIDACGRTLLDTINHILEYNQLNTAGKVLKSTKDATRDGDQSSASDSDHHDNKALVYTSVTTNIASILEETVEGLVSETTRQNSQSNDGTEGLASSLGRRKSIRATEPYTSPLSLSEHVDVSLAVDYGDWVFEAQSGAIRRCFINIIGNAIKYTDRGSISIELASEPFPESRAEEGRLMVFRVRDTGRGMSDVFLKSKVFTPFAQENHIAPGVGLGLSIVKGIANMLGGIIDIQSKPDEGTTVTLKIPLIRPSHSTDAGIVPRLPFESPGSDLIAKLRESMGSRPVAICEYDPDKTDLPGNSPVRFLAIYIKEWFGLNLVSWTRSAEGADFLVARTEHVTKLEHLLSDLKPGRRGVILLSRSLHGFDPNSPALADQEIIFQILTEPYGPYKLAKIFLQCLARVDDARSSLQKEEDVERAKNEDDKKGKSKSAKSPDSKSGDKTRDNAKKQKPVADTDSHEYQDEAGQQLPAPVMSDKTFTKTENTRSKKESKSSSPQSDDREETEDDEREEEFKNEKNADRKESPKNSDDFGQAPPDSEASVTPPKPDSYTPPPRNETAKTNTTDQKRPRILIVEDNLINQRLLNVFLRKNKKLRVIDTAENGRVALRSVTEANVPYDIIFMDISMPVMNGFEATAAIRAFEAKRNQEVICEDGKSMHGSPRANIIALTSLATKRDQDEATAAGMDGYMVKPVNFKDIGRLLNEWSPPTVKKEDQDDLKD